MKPVRCCITKTWDGAPLPTPEWVWVGVAIDGDDLALDIDAPYYGDGPPDVPPGPCWGLWEYEVVEVFLAGEDAHYVELECGPHGHHLALRFRGERTLVERDLPIAVDVQRTSDRWRAHIRIRQDLLPSPILGWNAYGIHGAGPARRYLALGPASGPQPDFHLLDAFLPWPPESGLIP